MVLNSGVVPSVVSHKINTIGGQYDYIKGNWNATFSTSKAISKQTLSEVSALFNYKLDSVHSIRFELKNSSKIPNSNYTLYQSNFINYNWYNNFSNEKISTFKISADTKWLSGSLTYTNLKDYLYFSNDSLVKIISTPKQYAAAINYLSFKLSKEINFRKWALDNTFLFQEVKQADKILNVPSIVLRNTLYFSDYYFSRALFLQTGVTLNYFTKYYGNAYNPLIGEFYVQTQQKIGDYPSLDFFISGRIRQTRIFLIAEHFNSNFSKFNFYAAPNYPYVDFLLRFGIAWNFFQ